MTLSRTDIICFSSIDWDFIWQGHQEIMSRLAEDGNIVLFVENTGVRPPTIRDLHRVRHRLRNWYRGVKGFRQEQKNLFVHSPLVLPFPYSRVARWLNRHLLVRALRRWMRAARFHRPIVWTFLPTPLIADLIREIDPELTIYYCIDDFASSSAAATKICRSEESVFRRSDLVFVTSEKLRQRAAAFSDRVHVFPFGVDLKTLEAVRQDQGPLPRDLDVIPRPIAGYVGGIHQWVDQDLLAEAAGRLPDISFVLVGPVQTDVSKLVACRNVHLLGARSHGDLARYVKGFDVGLIPYRLTEYTANVYPTKLNEYLAMGMPVVSTDLVEIRRFNQDHGDIVTIAGSVEHFAGAVRTAAATSGAGGAARRIDVARQNSWELRIATMRELIDKALLAKRTQAERWDVRLRRVYRRARRRVGVTVSALVIAGWVFFYTPAVWMLADPLRVAERPRPADAIVVFAGGVGESGKAGGGYQERVKQAVTLYRQGHARHIVFSSGYSFAFREAEIMRNLAVDQGVPVAAIVLETRAANTHENVVFVQQILRGSGWRRVLLVSSPYHMRRALLTWRKASPETVVIPTPVSESQFYAHEHGASLEQLVGIFHEYLAIGAYWWRGWI